MNSKVKMDQGAKSGPPCRLAAKFPDIPPLITVPSILEPDWRAGTVVLVESGKAMIATRPTTSFFIREQI
jgi:hypothetical protein